MQKIIHFQKFINCITPVFGYKVPHCVPLIPFVYCNDARWRANYSSTVSLPIFKVWIKKNRLSRSLSFPKRNTSGLIEAKIILFLLELAKKNNQTLSNTYTHVRYGVVEVDKKLGF